MDSDSSAIIVPAFFLKKEAILSKCGSLMECAMVSERNFPGTREELKDAIERTGSFKTMEDSCRELVLTGVTTVEEATRTINTLE